MARGDGAVVLTPQLLRSWPLPELQEGDSKLERGSVHVVGGAASTPGAVLLAGLAALRVGAGRLTITTVGQTAAALGVAVPESMVLTGQEAEGSLTSCELAKQPEAIVVGPGITAPGDLLRSVLKGCGDAGVVIDAVALFDVPDELPFRTVLTPNGRELRALADSEDGSDDELAHAVAVARGVVVATQGWVAAPDGRLWRNESGSVALATSGSGDVLAGVVGGLLARGADPAQAACWGQYLHAVAGERLMGRTGRVGLLARELLDELAPALAAVGT